MNDNDEVIDWLDKKSKTFANNFSMVQSLNFFLSLMEPNVKHRIEDIWTVKNSDMIWKEARYLMVTFLTIKKEKTIIDLIDGDEINDLLHRQIRNYMPDFKLIGEKEFIITHSPIYSKFGDIQKALLYNMWQREAKNEKHAINLPNRFKTPLFKKMIGYLYFYTKDHRYYIEDHGGIKLAELQPIVSNIIENELNIDTHIKPLFKLANNGTLLFKNEKVVAFTEKTKK